MTPLILLKGSETQDTKKCTKCLEVKSVESFHRSSQSKDGYQYTCKACTQARQSTPDQIERRRAYAWNLCLEKKGITQEQYDAMYEKQMGLCAICHRPESSRGRGGTIPRLAIDHDHSCCPGEIACGQCVRGLLCGNCNRGLGQFDDDPAILASALLYVKGKR